MPSRRLPNGRFAKFRLIPEKKSKASPRSRGGYILVRTNAGAVAQDLNVRRLSIDASMLDMAQKRAANIQAKMRGAAQAQYHRASTGRFARGIFAKVGQSKFGDKSETVIRVHAVNYRETQFLTNLGGVGHFKRFPVGPYKIWAKGARELANEVPIGTYVHTKRNYQRVQRDSRSGRLKVPRSGIFFEAFRQPGRGGGESRRIANTEIDLGRPTATPNVYTVKDRSFFYPIMVTHPGFPRDVLSEVAKQEGAKFVVESKGVVASTYGGKGERDTTNDLVVRNEIPLTGVRLVSGRGGISSRLGFSGPAGQSSAGVFRAGGDRFSLNRPGTRSLT